ncbi:TrkH family potassium uptake protein [Paenibacillus sp. FSL R7-0048]|jgi:trk system potassium uptake protein TrkH|uniref:TrkH family potassium uptake protein n=1 Tax=Paenibacillus TaxID=44249 RepID=UPI002016796C|nr:MULTISPECIES: TrkH family potassium uptake protein [Paenibacillus]MDH6430983.1 trk system potassium uptake protein TrkH [Paenibacillus sp. PastH-4]MDH6446817.1 trk system potassium uptake protein TrkH [Paenibacillus sp. PastF-4]MDH6531100.1 trk system potassium uptake protein TrkH [Paenibacillus sp. PastH-3]
MASQFRRISEFKFLKLSPPQILVLGFASIILIGALLLMLPISSTSGNSVEFIDALFTSTSATCVTGLVVLDTGTSFTIFGKTVIMILIQIGGLGFMTMATLFSLVLKRKISLRDRLILQEAMNQGSMEGIVRLIRRVLIYSLVIEGCAAVLLSIRWAFDMPLGKAIYYGIFHAVSMFNNAGFDIFGDFRSLTDYVYDPLVNIIVMFLIVSGGIGFIVMSDLVEFRVTRRLSLHSKVVLSTSTGLILIGALVIFIFEFTNTRTLGSLNFGGKILSAFFQSVSPRTAGANTVDIAGLRQATQFFIVILMFIGASPGSTGGGIKTTTFTMMIGAVIAMLRGREDVVLFRYRLAQERIYKALTITLLALLLIASVSMILSTTEDSNFLAILFETTSAFATVGLTMGLTPELSAIGKILLCLTMFAGRLGPLTLAYALGPKQGKPLYKYPEGKIIIG